MALAGVTGPTRPQAAAARIDREDDRRADGVRVPQSLPSRGYLYILRPLPNNAGFRFPSREPRTEHRIQNSTAS